jgi:murein DD-endopeptidase MepM/ murein hydrolase activator NlpD
VRVEGGRLRRTRAWTVLTGSLLVLSLLLGAVPGRADTASELRAARARLAAIRGRLVELARDYAAAEARYARTQDRIDAVRARIERVQARMASIRATLGQRARQAYESGGVGAVELLLSSDSFSQFSDRVQYLGTLARDDSDLLVQAAVMREELRRAGLALATLSRRQAATIRALQAQRDAIESALVEAQALERKLETQLAREEAARRAEAMAAAQGVGGGGLQSCPVAGHPVFGDDFGNPRPGGRTHQGIDMLAPYGTPVLAAQSGRFVQNHNTLGGISALVYADNGDYTYYAHMSSYAGVPNGARVSAGTTIGHVGNTGDARGGPYHLHFEYHPGGGAAVDPYRLLVAVCP